MEQFARDLRNFAGDYFSNPVVDQTGLKGSWDFEIKWMFRSARAPATAAGTEHISVFDAVKKQLGLKLETGKLPQQVVIVDSVNEKPTANPPGVNATLPAPPPAEFEVATIKPSQPGKTNSNGRIDHGRVNLENIPLKDIIRVAWDINADELMVGAPKFLDSTHFDITAKAPVPEQGAEVDFEDLRLMLHALLAERFELKTHMEERPVDGYVLESVKPKMQKADPSNRTGCKEGPGPDGKDPRIAFPILSRLITCRNMTMSQFVDQLPNLANGDAHGLKLELRKRPMQVLVIDHVNEKPTEN